MEILPVIRRYNDMIYKQKLKVKKLETKLELEKDLLNNLTEEKKLIR